MQGHNVIQNRLMDFDQEAGGQPIAFGFGKATQGMDIVAFGLISEIADHRETDAAKVDGANAEFPQEVIAFNADFRGLKFTHNGANILDGVPGTRKLQCEVFSLLPLGIA